VPQLNLIQNVSNSLSAVVTTITAHGYTTGMYVRVNVPGTYGMHLFEQTAIVVTSPTVFYTQIDTSLMDPFVAPSLYPPVGFTPAQCVPNWN
jgi:hypothetical protein